MLIGYVLNKIGMLEKVHLRSSKKSVKTIWVDAFQPTVQEVAWLKKCYDINIPSSEEVDKIEVMTPFYKEKNAYFMTATLIDHANNSIAITFILTPDCLFTLRYDDSQSLHNFATYATQNMVPYLTPSTILTALIEIFINKVGDILDVMGNELDRLIQDVLEKPNDEIGRKPQNYNSIIRSIGYTGNTISKNRESLASVNRTLMYFGQIEDVQYVNKKEHRTRMKHLGREITSMSEYASFLAQRNYFLLDGTLGMISVEQNTIIKILTIASVVFMPPTLVASIYGMNFSYMPELHSEWGYPLALSVIICSAVLPYLFFKKRGWV